MGKRIQGGDRQIPGASGSLGDPISESKVESDRRPLPSSSGYACVWVDL